MDKITLKGNTIIIRNKALEPVCLLFSFGMLVLLVCCMIVDSGRGLLTGTLGGIVFMLIMVLGSLMLLVLAGKRIEISSAGIDSFYLFFCAKLFHKHLDSGVYSFISLTRTNTKTSTEYEDVYISTKQGRICLFSKPLSPDNKNGASKMKAELEDLLAGIPEFRKSVEQ